MLQADLVFHAGRIATLDTSTGDVTALAIADGRIIAAGADHACLALAGPRTRVIDLDGAFIMPGINDSHCHPDGQALKNERWDDVSRAESQVAVLDRIAAFHRHAAPGRWYLGFRLDDRQIGGYPQREAVERAAPGRPVFLLRRDSQVGLASGPAYAELAASGAAAQVPPHCLDQATGLARGRGVFAFVQHISASDRVEDYLRGYPSLLAEISASGITSVHNALTSALAWQAYRQLKEQGPLPIRIGMMLNGRDQALVDDTIAKGLRFGSGDDQLYLLGVEYGSDGSTSGRTAAYHAPYVGQEGAAGEPANRGEVNFSAEELASKVTRVMQAGLQAAATGNGDRGIDFALDAFERGLDAHPNAIPPRIEHCCCAPPEIQARMARLRAIDSSAAGFAYSLGDAYLQNRPAEEMAWMWPHRDMLDRGVLVCAHSDAPVCDRNPFLGMWSMVVRKSASGASLDRRQAITAEEAMRCYTVNPARAEGRAHEKGTLGLGKLADLVILDRDPRAVDAADIRDTQVLATLVGGGATHRADAGPGWACELPVRE